MTVATPDEFPCGLLVTDRKQNIRYANRFFEIKLGLDCKSLCKRSLLDLLTPASRIFHDSYVLPLLFHERRFEEIHFTILDGDRKEIPVLVNAVLAEDGQVYWSIFSSIERDKLYQKLLDTQRELREQALELQSLSVTDELTGLLNRRELCRQYEIITSATKRTKFPLSMLVMDIDHFKKINDQLGHSTGDFVLKQVGKVFRQQGRESDVIARFGGDEFVLLLPDKSAVEAKEFARRLHEMIGQIQVDGAQITASIGIATAVESISFDHLFKRGDKALYKAKAEGRNNTCVLPSH